MKYRLLAIDLDGTLLNPDARVSEANRAALQEVMEADTLVVPCTGRSWREARLALDQVHDLGLDTGIFVTGAVISEIQSGRALNSAFLDERAAKQMVEALADLPEAVLVFREWNEAGHDYLVTGHGELTDNTEWWFEHSGVIVDEHRDLDTIDLAHTLRVGVVAERKSLQAALDRLPPEVLGDLTMHYFAAVPMPERDDDIYILEVFGKSVNKWRGIQWLAEQHGIATEQVAVIGDEINDVPMLEAAGCSIAMGNAVEDAKRAAKYQTKPNTEDGVAYAIEQMLEGKW